MGWVNWIAAAAVAPIEVEGALQYATRYAGFTQPHTVSGETVHTLTGLGYLVAVTSLLLTFVVGLIVFLPFPSWQQLVGFITSATVLSFGSGPIVLAAMRRQIPDYPRTFRIPFGDVIPFLAFYSSNLIVYWAGWDTDWKLFVAVALGFVVLALFHVTRSMDTSNLDLRAGATWVLPWLAGLCLISYLGDFPEHSANAGNTGDISFGWGFLVLLALSALVYWLAIAVRLPQQRVEENIEITIAEAAEEVTELRGPPA
jgi:amino acid transporter